MVEIIGMALRYFKCYTAPTTNKKDYAYFIIWGEANLVGLIGDNGVGKTAILQALDYFFNGGDFRVNVTGDTLRRKNKKERLFYIAPILKFSKDDISFFCKYVLEKKGGGIEEQEIERIIRKVSDNIRKDILKDSAEQRFGDSDFLFMVPVNESGAIVVPRFIEFESGEEDSFKKRLEEILKWARDYVKDSFEFVFISSEDKPEELFRLENDVINRIIGLFSYNEVLELERAIPDDVLKSLNKKLEEFVEKVNGYIGASEYCADAEVLYKYEKSNVKERRIRKRELVKLAVEKYLPNKSLYRKANNDDMISVEELSGGEKQKVFVDLVCRLSSRMRGNFSEERDGNYPRKKIIFAFDEPDSGVHISRVFSLFDKLGKISQNGVCVFFATHWHGFILFVNGVVVSLKKSGDGKLDSVVLMTSEYREQLRHLKEKMSGEVPVDIWLKSKSDFSQSILTNIYSDGGFNWIVCEGSSDKIYIEYYLRKLRVENCKVVPVGGVGEVLSIYKLMYISLDADKHRNPKGKVLFLVDTDDGLKEIELKDCSRNGVLAIKRLCEENEHAGEIGLCDYLCKKKRSIVYIEKAIPILPLIKKVLDIVENNEEGADKNTVELKSLYELKERLKRDDFNGVITEYGDATKKQLSSFDNIFNMKQNGGKVVDKKILAHEVVKCLESEKFNKLPVPRWVNDMFRFLYGDNQ